MCFESTSQLFVFLLLIFFEKKSKICTMIFQKMDAENLLWKCKKYTVDHVVLCFAIVISSRYLKKLEISSYIYAILVCMSL